MSNILYKVKVEEYIKGQGVRLNDYRLCLTKTDAEEFIKEFNQCLVNKNQNNIDWYLKASGIPEEFKVDSDTYKIVKHSHTRRYWLSFIKKL